MATAPPFVPPKACPGRSLLPRKTFPKIVAAILRDSLGGPERALTIIDTVAKNSGGMDEHTAGMKAFVNDVNTCRVAC